MKWNKKVKLIISDVDETICRKLNSGELSDGLSGIVHSGLTAHFQHRERR